MTNRAALNRGSSSLKFTLFDMNGASAEKLIEGEAEAIGGPQAKFPAKALGRASTSIVGPIPDHAGVPRRIFKFTGSLASRSYISSGQHRPIRANATSRGA